MHHGNVVDITGQSQNNLSHGPIDMNSMDDGRDQYMQYHVRPGNSFNFHRRFDSLIFIYFAGETW